MIGEEIYQFDSARDILVYLFHEKTKKNPLFSMRAWARKLGFRSPSQVAEVLSAKRSFTVEFGLRIANSLDLGEDQKTYFEALVYLNNAQTAEEKTFFAAVVKKLKPDHIKEAFGEAKFPELKEWYYGVFDEMICLSDFKEDPHYFARRLNNQLTPHAVRIAIKDMLKVGLIERDSKGKLRRPKKWFIEEEQELNKKEPESVRKYKKTFLEKTISALDEQDKSESFFRQTNTPISIKDFPMMIALANTFFEGIYELESNRKADEVFHVGLNCFRLTQPIEQKERP